MKKQGKYGACAAATSSLGHIQASRQHRRSSCGHGAGGLGCHRLCVRRAENAGDGQLQLAIQQDVDVEELGQLAAVGAPPAGQRDGGERDSGVRACRRRGRACWHTAQPHAPTGTAEGMLCKLSEPSQTQAPGRRQCAASLLNHADGDEAGFHLGGAKLAHAAGRVSDLDAAGRGGGTRGQEPAVDRGRQPPDVRGRWQRGQQRNSDLQTARGQGRLEAVSQLRLGKGAACMPCLRPTASSDVRLLDRLCL